MSVYQNSTNGTWYSKFNYKDSEGKTRFTTKRGFTTHDDALKYEKEYKARAAKQAGIEFWELVEIYRQETYSNLGTSTVARKDYIIDTKIIPYFRDFMVDGIQSEDVVAWQEGLMNYRDPKTGRPYAPTYLKAIYGEMNAIMNFAMNNFGLAKNPVKQAGSIGCDNAEGFHHWTLDEYLLFADAMAEDPYYHCFSVLYWTGIREEELFALSYDDFDFDEKTVTVCKSYQVVKGEKIIGQAKQDKARVIGMPDILCKDLTAYFKVHEDRKTGRAFPYSKSVLNRAITRGINKSGVRKICTQDLRHSHIALLIELGYNVVFIANRVGDKCKTIADRYESLFPGSQNIGRINELFLSE